MLFSQHQDIDPVCMIIGTNGLQHILHGCLQRIRRKHSGHTMESHILFKLRQRTFHFFRMDSYTITLFMGLQLCPTPVVVFMGKGDSIRTSIPPLLANMSGLGQKNRKIGHVS